jgi:SM-20-related protein
LPWQAAGTGKGASYRPVSVRGDRIAWLDLVAGTPAERAVGDHLRAVMAHLNRTLFLNLVDVEAHLAVYPPGHGYARHRDRFCNDDARTVSWVTYLNAPDWTEGDGGALRLHLPEGPQDVLPRRGTAVAFLSADIEHEVCAATRERWSIAAWFRQRPLG